VYANRTTNALNSRAQSMRGLTHFSNACVLIAGTEFAQNITKAAVWHEITRQGADATVYAFVAHYTSFMESHGLLEWRQQIPI
jgi:hypothetical protein